jgi:gliding motility-associated-like protein
VGDGTPIWYKNWSAVSVNLDRLAGKTIRLFFKTSDCTFRRHFGYAYLDVNSECSSEFMGAAFCPDDTAVNVTAPFGYQQYKWFNKDFTQVLGNNQQIRFDPPPAAGTTLAVEVVPYNGYGCIDTFYARLLDTLKVNAFAGPDRLFCGVTPVSIGANPKPGLLYHWTPETGLSNPFVANPLAIPKATTTFTLSVHNSGGGCLSTDNVVVQSSSIDSLLEVIGKTIYCEGTNDSAVLKVSPATTIQWYRDGTPIGAGGSRYRVTRSGDYFAKLISDLGCMIDTRSQAIVIDKAKPGVTYPVQYAEINLPQQLVARDFGDSLSWSPPIYLDHPETLRPLFTGDEDQLYSIRIKTNTGCITVDTQLVKVVSRADIFVPTAFTPNGDGKNDVLRPVLMGIKELVYFRVYNRWGELVFETKTFFDGWNGKHKGKPTPTETFVWIAEGVGANGKIYFRKGSTTLIR